MKTAILIACLFLFVAAPVDAAEPDPECAEKDLHKSIAGRVTLRRDCSLEAAILEDITCVGGWGGSVERDVDRHTVTAYYCTGGPFPPVALPPEFAGPNCKPTTQSISVGTFDLRGDCHVQVDIKFYDCVWNCGWETIVSNDHVTVRYYTQQNSGASIATAQPCQDGTAGFWGAQVDTRSDCTADVGIIDSYRVCPTGTDPAATSVSAGGNNVYAGYCTVSAPTKAPSCNGIWYYEETFAVGRNSITVGTDGSLDCTHVTVG